MQSYGAVGGGARGDNVVLVHGAGRTLGSFGCPVAVALGGGADEAAGTLP